MGICFGSPANEKAQEPFDASNMLVGPTHRFNNDLEKLEDIKPERQSMAALEMLAELETIYRRKRVVFANERDLDFSADKTLYFLRNILDEPIGRYYLSEFVRKRANYSDLDNFIQLWTSIHLLDKVEVTLQDVQLLQDAEKKATIAKESMDATASLKDKSRTSMNGFRFTGPGLNFFGRSSGRISSKFEEVFKRESVETGEGDLVTEGDQDQSSLLGDSVELGDDAVTQKKKETYKARRERNKETKVTVSGMEDEGYSFLAEDNISVAAGIKDRPAEDVKGVIKDATKLVHMFLANDAVAKVNPSFLLTSNICQLKEEEATARIKNFNQLVSDTLEEFKRKLLVQDVQSLRKNTFKELENEVLRILHLTDVAEEFRKHSEFQRYEDKYKNVYNFVCHKDFDYMQTLGKGSFGRVIRVRKKTTKKQYALKVMSKKKILSGAEKEQAAIEKEVLMLCFSCKFVVGLKFAFQTSRALFIALDLLEGGTLTDAMNKGKDGKLSVEQVRTIAANIILGLNHLHLHGILYRDLKPVNVMLNSKGQAVLTDMGLCAKYRICLYDQRGLQEMESEMQVVDAELILPYNEDLIKKDAIEEFYRTLRTKNRMSLLKIDELKCVGTPSYRAPELLAITSSSEINRKKDKKGFKANRGGYGHEVDYWALGVTLYFLVTGMYPFRSRAKINIFGPTPDIKANEISQQKANYDFRKEFNDLDAHFGDLVHGLLSKEPEKRLGHNMKELQRHPFFVKYDYEKQEYKNDEADEEKIKETWRKIQSGEITPLYQPRVKTRSPDEKPRFKGLSDAMRQFAQENVLELFGGAENDMIEDFKKIKTKYQRYFDGWDYIPDELLKHDWKLLEKYFEE